MAETTGSCVSLYIATGVVTVTVLLLYIRRAKSSPAEPHPRDTVMLHQLGKGVHAPSISPFVLKLETYLRMSNIPYKNLFDKKMSSKGKTPWIEYNGEQVPDSEFCIEYLSAKFNVDLNSKFSHSDRAIGRAFRKLAEEDVYWYIGLSRCVYDRHRTIFSRLGLRWLIRKILERKALTSAWHHGIGRHSETEVTHIAVGDLKALSDFIGDKRFLLGDTPCQEDCAVFGILAQVVWQMPGSDGERAVNEKYANLRQYCVRIKDKYWPDWDDRVMESV
ncbi:failed axon connections homolog [Haliotis cracherodii]|uniref:failed axon connections homolog n=1 Tax=Haliotis cracherodii TaxID=6455 RepID=UPI0039EC33EA